MMDERRNTRHGRVLMRIEEHWVERKQRGDRLREGATETERDGEGSLNQERQGERQWRENKDPELIQR